MHTERIPKKDGSYAHDGKQDIDPSRTNLNYNLAPARDSPQAYIDERLKTVSVVNRSNLVYLICWTVTQPKTLPPTESKSFFTSTYQFLVARYKGENNVVSAHVHMDETTPHLHFSFIPIVKTSNGGEKLCAREVIYRGELQRFHKELSNHLASTLSYPVDVLNPKMLALMNANDEADARIKKLITEKRERKEAIQRTKTQLTAINQALKPYRELDVQNIRIDDIELTESIFGTIKGISTAEIHQLKLMAIKSIILEADLNQLQADNQYLSDQLPTVDEHIEAMNQKEKLDQIENALKILNLTDIVEAEILLERNREGLSPD
jgi:hypothetical protein